MTICRDLNLRQPIYQSTSCYGHFGREGFAWENAKPLNLDWLDGQSAVAQDGAAAANITIGPAAVVADIINHPSPNILPPALNVDHVDKKARFS